MTSPRRLPSTLANLGSTVVYGRQEIEATETFAKGLLRIVEEGGVFKGVVNTISGHEYLLGDASEQSFAIVINEANRYGVSEFTPIFGASLDDVVTGKASVSQYQRLEDITRNLNEAVFGSTSDFAAAARQHAGIGDLSGDLSIERLSFLDASELGGLNKDGIAQIHVKMNDIADEMFLRNQLVGHTFTHAARPQGSDVGLLNIQGKRNWHNVAL